MPLEKLDFRSITRDSDKVRCQIRLDDYTHRNSAPWLIAGRAFLRENQNDRTWTLDSRLRDGATDFEHDAGKAFSLNLVGLQFLACQNGVCEFSAFIHADHDGFALGFNVPNAGYDPFKNATPCSSCKGEDAHVIVPEGCYVPKHNAALWEKVRGKRVRIMIGPNWVMEEEQ